MPNGIGALDLSSLNSFGTPGGLNISGGGGSSINPSNFLDPTAIANFNSLPISSPVGNPTAGGSNLQNILLGGKDNTGVLGLGFDFLSGLSNYKLLSDQLDLSQDQFDFSKAFANRNLQNQAKTINTQLEDRQNARLGSVGDSAISGTGYESLESYLDANRISEAPVRS